MKNTIHRFLVLWEDSEIQQMLREKTGANSRNLPRNRKHRNGNAENQFYPVCETDKEA